MFEYHKKVDTANLLDMRDDIIENIKGFYIQLPEFDVFFKDYANQQYIKEPDFVEICNYYETKILEKAAVFDQNEAETQPNVDVQMEDKSGAEPQTLDEVVISDSDDSDMADGDENDPEAIIKRIFEASRGAGATKTMDVDKVIKMFYKFKNIYDDKFDGLKDKTTSLKNKNDVLKNEKEYFKKKVDSQKSQISELKESNYNLKADVDDLMKFEKDFQKMLKQNQEKDDEIMKLEDQIDDFKHQIYSMQMRQKT